MAVRLNYGRQGRFSCEIDPARILAARLAPPVCASFSEAAQAAFAQPLDFPPLAQAFVPGDRVVLALDRHTPRGAELVAEIWKLLEPRGVEADGVLILQPAGLDGGSPQDARRELPDDVRQRVQWKIHDPTDEKQQAYLATSAKGERIYLARDLVEADVAVSVGELAYNPVIGYRGTGSVFYPGLSSVEALSRAHGVGHSELGPDDERPLRQTIDEISWLLGNQFSIQVIAAGGNDVSEVLAGASDAVFRHGKQLLAEHWFVPVEERAHIVIAAVDADAAGHGWRQIGAALATARNLVKKGGKIVILSEMRDELDTGMQLLRDSRNPRNALQPLRKATPPDMIPATQLAVAADWAHIYFLSRMDSDVVDDLFMVPLENEREVQRLIGGDGSCVLLGSAQHVYGEVQSNGTR